MIRLTNERTYTVTVEDALEGTSETFHTDCLIATYDAADENGAIVLIDTNCGGETIVHCIDALYDKLDSFLADNPALKEPLFLKRNCPGLYAWMTKLMSAMEGNDEQDD